MGFFSRKKDSDKKADTSTALHAKGRAGNAGTKPDKVNADKKSEKVDNEKPKTSMKDLYSGVEKNKVPDSEKKSDSKKATTKKISKKYGNAYKILVKPLITEKASRMGAENKYLFEVKTSANKIEIAKAVSDVYGVKPVSVNIIRTKGKSVRSGRLTGKRKDWKKAVVTLKQGDNIKIYEGV